MNTIGIDWIPSCLPACASAATFALAAGFPIASFSRPGPGLQTRLRVHAWSVNTPRENHDPVVQLPEGLRPGHEIGALGYEGTAAGPRELGDPPEYGLHDWSTGKWAKAYFILKSGPAAKSRSSPSTSCVPDSW